MDNRSSGELDDIIKRVFDRFDTMSKEEIRAELEKLMGCDECSPDTCQGQCQGMGDCAAAISFRNKIPEIIQNADDVTYEAEYEVYVDHNSFKDDEKVTCYDVTEYNENEEDENQLPYNEVQDRYKNIVKDNEHLKIRLAAEQSYNRRMDAVIDDEKVAISCINPIEDLQNAIRKLKENLEKSEKENEKLKQQIKDYEDYIEGDLDKLTAIYVKWKNGGSVLLNDLPTRPILLELWGVVTGTCRKY